ncbi:hypothetical protein BDQ17DRAFT_1255476 [Cyathus striatus]|nr:hypothetical protein BDQ17DRAFT_1255476 [Cyathus striatus]
MAAPSMDHTFGALYIGSESFSSFQGVLTVQAYTYFESFSKDPIRTKVLVRYILSSHRILDFVHLILISRSGYHYLISSWGNNEALIYSTHELNLHLALVGVATIFCQLFFLRRIWVLSGRNIPLIITLITGCLATVSLDIALSTQIMGDLRFSTFSSFTPEIVSVFVIGAVTDITMAGLMCFYLQRERSGFQKTDSLVTRIMHYTIATGAATSVLALGCLITAMHFSLGRMYTNALLATLNGRRSLREALQMTPVPGHSKDNHIHVHSGGIGQESSVVYARQVLLLHVRRRLFGY